MSAGGDGGVRLAVAVRRLAVRLLPAELRRRYGREMEAAFEEAAREAARDGGWALAAWTLRELRDLARAAAAARWRGAPKPSASGSRRVPFEPISELRPALRSLLRRPAYAGTVVAILAVAVGGGTAVFALVNGVLLRPLPYPDEDGVVHVYQTNPELGWERGPVSFPNFADWRRRAEVFESLSAFRPGLRQVLRRDAAPLPVRGTAVTGDLFRTLGVAPVHGRGLEPGEEGPEAPPTVVLGHGLWSEAFGADPGVVGRTVVLDGTAHEVVGVMPLDFPPLWPGEQYWVPLRMDAATAERDQNALGVVGRLRPGVGPGAAQNRMERLVREIERTHPGGNRGRQARVVPRREVLLGDVRTPVLVLMGGAVLLLLVAAANLATLAVVRGRGRGEELAVRAALGAGRLRLLRVQLVEAAVLCALGTTAAVPVTLAVLRLVRALAPEDLPRRWAVAPDPAVWGFAAAAAAAMLLVFGWLPARGAAARAAGASTGRSARSTRPSAPRVLVALQVALAVVLLGGAGLLAATFDGLRSHARGFAAQGVLTFRVRPPAGAYESPAELDDFHARAQAALERIPGVEAVGGTWSLPLGSSFASSTYRPASRPGQEHLVNLVPVRGDYFGALQVPLVAGRAFRPTEGDGDDVAIVTRSFAERAWPAGDAVGRRLLREEGDELETLTVIGVVEDVVTARLGEDAVAQAFQPHRDAPWARDLYWALRSADDPLELVPAVQAALRSVDERAPAEDVATMEARVSGDLARPRLHAVTVGVFAGLAALLATLGVYGLTAYLVLGRTRELGVRLALGARRGALVARTVAGAVGLAAAGAALGLLLGLGASGIAEGLLFGVRPTDPRVHGAAALLVVAAAALAAWIPARHAGRVDPVRALREEG